MKNKIDNFLTKRKLKDGALNGLTGLSSLLSLVMLIGIILFITIKSVGSFDFRMITADYYETPYFALVETNSDYSFDLEDEDGVYYSSLYGIGLKDDKDIEGNACISIVYIDNLSPMKNATDVSTGEKISISTGQIVKRVQVYDGSSTTVLTTKAGAEEMVNGMDKGTTLKEFYYSTMGGGIRGSLLTTVLLIGITLLIALPIGIIAALYLALYAKKNKITIILHSLIDMIAGVPSIIFGLFAVIVFIPFVSNMTGNSGGSILSGALTMAVILLPTIIKTTEESINNIPKGYQLSSLALGASQTQTTFKVILPNAIPGIITSVLLSIGRIIGESAALIFAIGTAIQDEVSLFGGSTTLAVHIWSILSGENPNYGMACSISFIILVVVLILNIAVKLICKKLNKFEVK